MDDDANRPVGGVGEVPASTGGAVDLDRILGRIPVVLVFLEPDDDPPALEVITGLGRRLADFGRDRIQLLAVARRSQRDVQEVDASVEGHARILADPDGTLAERFGASYLAGRPTTVLVGADGEVAAHWVDAAEDGFADDLLARIERLDGRDV